MSESEVKVIIGTTRKGKFVARVSEPTTPKKVKKSMTQKLTVKKASPKKISPNKKQVEKSPSNEKQVKKAPSSKKRIKKSPVRKQPSRVTKVQSNQPEKTSLKRANARRMKIQDFVSIGGVSTLRPNLENGVISTGDIIMIKIFGEDFVCTVETKGNLRILATTGSLTGKEGGTYDSLDSFIQDLPHVNQEDYENDRDKHVSIFKSTSPLRYCPFNVSIA